MSALLTARHVAGMLGVSTETVLRWTRRGDLPALRLPGGAIRFRQAELDGWLTSRATCTLTVEDEEKSRTLNAYATQGVAQRGKLSVDDC